MKNKANPVEPGQQVTAMKSTHSDLMESIIKREQAGFGGAVPGIVLDAGTAVSVATGSTDVITLAKKADVDGRTFALVDGEHCLAMITLEDPIQKDNGEWDYTLDTVIAIEPVVYSVGQPDEDGFIASVEMT